MSARLLLHHLDVVRSIARELGRRYMHWTTIPEPATGDPQRDAAFFIGTGQVKQRRVVERSTVSQECEEPHLGDVPGHGVHTHFTSWWR
jgi:hypothetical protein